MRSRAPGDVVRTPQAVSRRWHQRHAAPRRALHRCRCAEAKFDEKAAAQVGDYDESEEKEKAKGTKQFTHKFQSPDLTPHVKNSYAKCKEKREEIKGSVKAFRSGKVANLPHVRPSPCTSIM